MSSKTCDLDYPTSKDVCAHLLPLQINKFFTSVSHEFWQGIDLYYYDREKGLSLEQCFLQYCGDLRKIQDGQYGTKVEKDRARIILNDVTIEKFKKGKPEQNGLMGTRERIELCSCALNKSTGCHISLSDGGGLP